VRTDAPEALILDLIEWLARRERSYEETMEAWRTSCPRLPVWEDANDRGLVRTENSDGRSVVRVTAAGLGLLEETDVFPVQSIPARLLLRYGWQKIPSRRLMSKEDSIEVTGTVVEKFPSGLFSVQLDQDRTVLAHLAGKLRRNRIRVLAGDRVTLELSPYDLTKGRITYRHK